MGKISPLMALPPMIFFGLAILFYVGMQRDNPNALPSSFKGKSAPDVALESLGGAPLFEDELLRTGGVKLVNFWASWCAPCRVEHPNLQLLADEGVTIYGVNYKDDPEKALGFLSDLGNPYAALGADARGRMALNWGLYGVPETYVLDADGTIVLRFAGPITSRVLEGEIRPAIEEAAR